MKKITLILLTLACSHIMMLSPAGAQTNDDTPYTQYIERGHMNPERLVAWTWEVVESKTNPKAIQMRAALVQQIPRELKTGDAMDDKNLLITLNKALEGVYTKLAAQQQNQPQHPERTKAKMMSALMSYYLDVPVFRVGEYDQRRGVLKAEIVDGKTNGGKVQQVIIPIELTLKPDQAQYVKAISNGIHPLVFLELDNGVLTAKYLDFFAERNISEELASYSEPLAKGMRINVKLDQTFSASQAAAYDRDIQSRKKASDEQNLADLKRYQWYPIYAKFLDTPIACAVIKSEIRRAGAINGSSAEGQARTAEYAKQVAASTPRCVK